MKPIEKTALAQLFTEARTHHAWLPQDVSDELLRSLYDLTKWGPTSVNAAPMRILFVKSKAEKERLYPALGGSNVEQVKGAPVTAIVAYDEKFYDQLPKLFPAFDAKSMFVGNKSLSESTAFRNSSLQGAYLMLAARALGLDVGPMSGFDNAKVDETFFAGTSWKSNFICNIGYGDAAKLYPRGPRLEFEEVCRIV
ncbi:MAG: malonic semialdehyde reductase [Bacteriovoracia bacterium]